MSVMGPGGSVTHTAGRGKKNKTKQVECKRQEESKPEESFAAFARHGVEVEAGGLVAAHAADPRGIAVELLRPNHRRRHRHGLHHCGGEGEEEENGGG